METTALAPESPKKPSFADAYFGGGLSIGMIDLVAELAKVDQAVVVSMMQGLPVLQADARRVLWAVNELLAETRAVQRVDWTLDMLDIPLKDERS